MKANVVSLLESDSAPRARAVRNLDERNEKRARRRQPDRIRDANGYLLSPHLVSERLGVTTDTLRTWRYQMKGPPAVRQKNSTRVWYDEAAFNLWKEENHGFVDCSPC